MAESKYIVTLSNLKKNTLEFELEANGIAVQEANVNLVIEAASMGLMFEAKQIGTRKWEVEIPPLPMLKRTTYPFKITLASEGYYFEPMLGNVNVVGNESVKVTSVPSNVMTESYDAKKLDRLTAAFAGKNPAGIMALEPGKGKESRSSGRVKVFEDQKTLSEEELRVSKEMNEEIARKEADGELRRKTKSILSEEISNLKSPSDIKSKSKKDELVSMILSEMKTEPKITTSSNFLKKRGVVTH